MTATTDDPVRGGEEQKASAPSGNTITGDAITLLALIVPTNRQGIGHVDHGADLGCLRCRCGGADEPVRAPPGVCSPTAQSGSISGRLAPLKLRSRARGIAVPPVGLTERR